MLKKFATLARDPVLGVYVLRSKYSPAKLIERLSRMTRSVGIPQPRFLLSFDCDTDLDIEVVERVHERLKRIGIVPVYAVPGELLERGRSVYGKIARSGAQFINHGWAEHTRLIRESKTYDSFLFYDQQSRDWIEEDVCRGVASVAEVTGAKPRGFRTPHFGSYQSEGDLRFLHALLKKTGHSFSTSTIPLWGLRFGPVFYHLGLPEVPVSGCFEKPLRILDTWSHHCLGHNGGDMGFCRQFELYQDFLGGGNPLLINIYGDPSQVYDWEGFFSAVELLAPWSVSTYEDALAGVGLQ